MTYRFLILLIITAFLQKGISQPGNLVPNPGFEDRVTCVWNDGTLTDCPPWFRPTGGTPDVFHVCAVVVEDPCPYPEPTNWNPWAVGVPTNFVGCQEPHSGEGYAGGFFYNPGVAPVYEWREYLAVELIEPLQANEEYIVRYYVSLAERSTHALWALQVAFLHEPIYNLDSPTFISIEPSLTHTTGDFITDKEGWEEISGVYTALGGERYMYMGNFQANINTEAVDVMNGQSTQSHYLNSAYYYIDDVYVGSELLSVSEPAITQVNFWPNPAINELNIAVKRSSEITVYTLTGTTCLPPTRIDGQYNLNMINWASGVYLLRVEDSEKSEVYKFVKW